MRVSGLKMFEEFEKFEGFQRFKVQGSVVQGSRVHMFYCSNVLLFKCSNVQGSTVRWFKCYRFKIQWIKCSTVLLFKCSVVQMFRGSIFKFSNYQIIKLSNCFISLSPYNQRALFTIHYSLSFRAKEHFSLF